MNANNRKSLAGLGKAQRKMSLKLKRRITDEPEKVSQQVNLSIPKKSMEPKDTKGLKRRGTKKDTVKDYDASSKKSIQTRVSGRNNTETEQEQNTSAVNL